MSFPKVLIIDDEEDICFLLSSLLKSSSIVGEYALSIKEGVGKIEEVKPHLIFLDISLPDGCGLKAISNFKKLSPGLKVVIISAYDSDEDREEAIAAGADSFVSKPFSKSIVNEVLNRLIPSIT